MFFRLSSNIWISQTLYVWLVFTTQLGSLYSGSWVYYVDNSTYKA
jgi:hypothetical protein